ncbi:hypothetical protein diail_10110 [Diaporthe ilicicola]|nr:hypothetical protein diail_10110 [Diaporthe ilicicola]
MSLFSFLASFLPAHLIGDQAPINQPEDAVKKLDGFPHFHSLPPELRHMIIQEALQQEEYDRVVLLDPVTHRISPTKELASMVSPLLFVNSEFRTVALGVYTKVNVFVLDAPKADDQYGDESDWYMLPESLQYLDFDCDICELIDMEAGFSGVPQGCLYINPKKDTFIIGIVPRQVALSTAFRTLHDEMTPSPWDQPRDYVTAPLPQSVYAKITTMRELEWDLEHRCLACGTCSFCGRIEVPCCTEDFFDGRGADWGPFYREGVYTSIESYGFYVLAGGEDMQIFLHDLTTMGGKTFLEEWSKRYLEFDLGRLES